ncbi:flavin-containing amine oxidoreductase-domain containing protein [Dissophora ornata]|nr:hypothetical protein BGZ58_010494 [Dissophora ornata]KAI8599167.1 flavin-containing amine oxidoreductase-domain containing protein [Dissophora ornata]
MHSKHLSELEKQRAKRKTALRQLATSLGPAWIDQETTPPALSALERSREELSSPSHVAPLRGTAATASLSRRSSRPMRATAMPDQPDSQSRSHSASQPQRKRLRQERRDEQRLSEAAHAARLPAHGLCAEEFELFQRHLRQSDLESYLRVRNTILWLWRESPKEPLTLSRAFEATKGYGLHHGLIAHVFEFLLRSGYINFGACSFLDGGNAEPSSSAIGERKTIAVIGSGIAGIAVARQLENLFRYFASRFAPELPPKVVVLEARSRIGGRIHSMELGVDGLNSAAVDPPTSVSFETSSLPRTTAKSSTSTSATRRPTTKHAVDLGAQIITGFDDGNPMEIIVRRQLSDLALHYLVNETCDLFDHDGQPVSKTVDLHCESIFNQLLDKARQLRENEELPRHLNGYLKARLKWDRIWKAPGRVESTTLPTLGHSLDFLLETHPEFHSWAHNELGLIHWHYANLEFANATPLDQLSLRYWDQDDDYEFSGPHSMVVQGYGQVTEALSHGLDIRLGMPVDSIIRLAVSAKTTLRSNSDEHHRDPIQIRCRDGTTLDCITVVTTVPLGVLKSGQIRFLPPLPEWKESAIQRLGFGLLNKLVLVFDKIFWDPAIELFGYVASGEEGFHEMKYNRRVYRSSRGKFYMFWNCSVVSGLPVLVTLMAGQSAYDCESVPKEELVEEALETLAFIYPEVQEIPTPIETIVTRWSQDEFAQGSYSFVGREGSGEDYDLLARPVDGQLYFAGEATSRHYPATAHGAYLSGLNVAKDILDSLIGAQVVRSSLKDDIHASDVLGSHLNTTPSFSSLAHEVVVPHRKGKVSKSLIAEFVAELSDNGNLGEKEEDHLHEY